MVDGVHPLTDWDSPIDQLSIKPEVRRVGICCKSADAYLSEPHP